MKSNILNFKGFLTVNGYEKWWFTPFLNLKRYKAILLFASWLIISYKVWDQISLTYNPLILLRPMLFSVSFATLSWLTCLDSREEQFLSQIRYHPLTLYWCIMERITACNFWHAWRWGNVSWCPDIGRAKRFWAKYLCNVRVYSIWPNWGSHRVLGCWNLWLLARQKALNEAEIGSHTSHFIYFLNSSIMHAIHESTIPNEGLRFLVRIMVSIMVSGDGNKALQDMT